MMTSLSAAHTALLLFVALGIPAKAATVVPERTCADALVQDAARTMMREHNIPGLAVALTANGKQRFFNYGVASRETGRPVTSDTLFEIGSISKTLSATLAAYAQATGQLSLNESPSKYIPELRKSNLDRVTLIHLGTHTAGGFPLQLPSEIEGAAPLLNYFRTWTPSYIPGAQRTYANPSIGLLSMATAKSLGMRYDEAMERHLFPKLGMPRTYINVPPSKISLYAQGYDKEDAPVRMNARTLAAEAYGVKTSAKDILRFIELNLRPSQGGRQLQDAIAATHVGYYKLGAMTQSLVWEQYSYPVELNALLEGNSAEIAYRAHPVTTLVPPAPRREDVWINKTGGTGGFSAYVAFVPAKGTGIAVLANKNYPAEARLRFAHRVINGLTCRG